MHVHVGVKDLDSSIRFYSTLFGIGPTVLKHDYAKWMLEDPRVNFAISARNQAVKGVEHLGIQVESSEELGEVYARLQAADRPVIEEGATTCCYAKSEKSWITDPSGVVWETFFTSGDATVYSNAETLTAASIAASNDACCVPSTAKPVPERRKACC
jgi:hypothetical protein